MGSAWQLIDRPVEQRLIAEALSSDTVSGVVLVGPAGIGKTTLARTLTKPSVLTVPSATVHWAACTATSRAIPLGVFAPWIGLCSGHDPIALLSASRQALLAGNRSIICVDDAHLLDQLSATMLHHVAVERAARIVLTVRSGEPVSDAVTSLWKDGYLLRLDLQPMSKSQCATLAQQALGGTLEGLSADVLWRTSGGSPLYLRHLLEGALQAGNLTEVDGIWQLRGRAAVTSSLVALLDEQLNRAGEATAALHLLALCEPLDIDTLTELCGEACVNSAEAQGFIRIARDGLQTEASFSHPLYGEVIRRRLGTASARMLRGQLTQVLRRQPLDSAAARIRLAQLSAESDRLPDNSLLVAAARDAIALANLPLGEQLARTAFDHGDGLRAGALLARAVLWQGRADEADAVLARFNPDDLDELLLLLWGIPRLSILFWSVVDVEATHDLLVLLRSRIQQPERRSIVEGCAAAVSVHQNDIEAAISASTAVLNDPCAPEEAIDFATFAAGLAMPVSGRSRSYVTIALRYRAEPRTTDGMIRLMIRYFDVLALAYLGDLDRAGQLAAEFGNVFSEGQFMGWAIAKIATGLVATCRGQFRDAITEIEQALAALNAKTPLPWRLVGQLLLIRSYTALGQFLDAERVLADAARRFGPQVALFGPEMLIARAWLAAARGGHRTAIDLARRAATEARQSKQYAVEAEALHHAARFGDRTSGSRLVQLAGDLDGKLAVLYADHAVALANSDAERLDAVSLEFEAVGLLLAATDAAAQAATAHDRAGRRRLGALAAARVADLAERCGGVITPAIRAAAQPLPLSSREHEIASLVAEGLSNRDIADKLCMSVRTAEGHIYRACLKLDAADREELAALIRWPMKRA